MEICVYKKDYFKESNEIQKAIILAMENLYERIRLHETQNTPFERIFNDDKVKYDKHGKFYTFKCQKSNVQLRILYAYLLLNGEPILVIADYITKKKNNKNYIKQFDEANSWEPYNIYSVSKLICNV